MRRRPRRVREIPFSFDSFLDVVANVTGIIIRLILVVWVGARSYGSIKYLMNRPNPAQTATAAETILPEDPFESDLAQHRADLAEAQKRLLDQLRQLQQAKEARGEVEARLAQVIARRQGRHKEKAALDQAVEETAKTGQDVALSLAELRRRQQQLLEDIRAVEQLPPISHILRYQTPVSRPVHSEEFMFECREGKVTYIDLASLQAEIKRDMEGKGQLLRTQWRVADMTPCVGPFRLRYTLERERGLIDAVLPGDSPESNAGFRYGLSEWQVEAVTPVRGEGMPAALERNSEFRRLVDALDPQQAVVTFWVYPDSFALYRGLRDYLYERDLVVAGRPLPQGHPISCSRTGSLSRGQ
jgi:hypothetical protein